MRHLGQLLSILLFAGLVFVALVLIASLVIPRARAQSGISGPPIYCTGTVKYDTAVSGSTVLATATSGPIYICGFDMSVNTSTNISLGYAVTGTNCATVTAITPAYRFLSVSVGATPLVDSSPTFRGALVPSGSDLCLTNSAGTSAQVLVFVWQQH